MQSIRDKAIGRIIQSDEPCRKAGKSEFRAALVSRLVLYFPSDHLVIDQLVCAISKHNIYSFLVLHKKMQIKHITDDLPNRKDLALHWLTQVPFIFFSIFIRGYLFSQLYFSFFQNLNYLLQLNSDSNFSLQLNSDSNFLLQLNSDSNFFS